MTNTVLRPLQIDPDGTFDSRYWLRDDPLAAGPQGEDGPQGPPGPTGPEGQAVRIRWTVANAGLLPSVDMVLGDGALVGASAPYTLYVYTNNPTPAWVNAGVVTAGPKGDQGDPGPQGPAVPLAGSGVADTAARSDHNHAVSDVAGLQTLLNGKNSAMWSIDSGTSALIINPTAIRAMDGIYIAKGADGLADTIDIFARWGGGTNDIPRGDHSHNLNDLGGTLSEGKIAGLSGAKITSGKVSTDRLNVGTSASDVAAGNHTHAGYAATNHTHTLGALFPLNGTVITSRLARTAPGSTHNAVGTLAPGHQVYNTGIVQTTDESWTYIFSPSAGFCWFPTVAL